MVIVDPGNEVTELATSISWVHVNDVQQWDMQVCSYMFNYKSLMKRTYTHSYANELQLNFPSSGSKVTF